MIREKEKTKEINMSPTEKTLFDIWCEVLKTGEISLKDNFFDIGGNSLLAISLFSKIESAFKLNLKLRVFFDSPRISDLARVIEIALLASSKAKKEDNSKQSTIIDGEI